MSVGASQDHARDAVLDLSRVGASMSFGWQGNHDELGTGFEALADTAGGGVCLNFCSTKCLRAFLSECVNNLEYLIEAAKAESALRALTRDGSRGPSKDGAP